MNSGSKMISETKIHRSMEKDGSPPKNEVTHVTVRQCPICHGKGVVPTPTEIVSMSELARAVGISRSHASRMFSPNRAVREFTGCSLRTALRTSRYMGITIEEFASMLGVENWGQAEAEEDTVE